MPPPVAAAFTLTSPSGSSNGGAAMMVNATATVARAMAAAAAVARPPRQLPGSFSAAASALDRPLAAALAPTALLRVTVSDPQRAAAAADTPLAPLLLISTPHLSYRVAGESTLPGYAAAASGGGGAGGAAAALGQQLRCSFAVRRRFSCFVVLRSLLVLHHRGYVVAPLPEKAFLDAKVAALAFPPEEGGAGGDGKAAAAAAAPLPSSSSSSSASSSFVAVRTADLAAFMRTVVEHPVLRQSAALRVFLTHAGPEGAWKEAAAAADPSSRPLQPQSSSATQPPPPPPLLLQAPPAWRAALPNAVLALRCKHSLMSAAASLATAASSGAAALMTTTSTATATATTTSASKQQLQRPSPSSPPPSSPPLPQPGQLSLLSTPPSRSHIHHQHRTLPPIPVPEDELELRSAREATAALGQQLGATVAASRALVGRMAGLAADFGALSASLAAFSRWEDERARRGGQYTAEGSASLGRASVLQTAALGGGRSEALLRSGAARAAAALVGLHDLLALVPEAGLVLEARERAHSDLAVLETEARDRLSQLQRARDAEAAMPFVAAAASAAGPPNTTREARRVAAAKAAYDSAEAQAAGLRAAYAEEARRNRFELDRLSALRSSGQRAALAGLARSQRELAGAYGELWASIEAQLLKPEEEGNA